MTTNANRRPIHAYLEPDTHAQWHDAARRRRLSVSAIIEALGPEIDKILDEWPGLDDAAGLIDAARRDRS